MWHSVLWIALGCAVGYIATFFAGASAGDASNTAINSGDTAWMLASSALVMIMTPAVGFFYGGMVSSKNVRLSYQAVDDYSRAYFGAVGASSAIASPSGRTFTELSET